jgi:cytochrome b561
MLSNKGAASTVVPVSRLRRPHPAPTAGPRSVATRMLHASMLLAVLYQLIGSQFLSRPIPGEAPEFNMVVHQYVGLACMALVLVFWLWTLIRRGETKLGRLLPWLSPTRTRAVLNDVRDQMSHILRGEVPVEADGAMASAIHGLGLLTVTAMAITGTVYFIVDGGAGTRTILSLHKLLSNLMWVYLVGHAAMALLHHLLGSDILSRMFWHRHGHL